MWHVRELEFRERVLDFTSSGQGCPTVTALYADGVCIANALPLMEFDSDHIQVQICEACGVVHCEPGGWVCLRRLGTLVLWVPCFDRMAKDEHGLTEYAPPRFALGLPAFPEGAYQELAARVPGFSAIGGIRGLSSREAVRILQAEAPARLLGTFPSEPALVREELLLTHGDQQEEAVTRLKRLLRHAWTNDLVAVPGPESVPVEFYLDIRGTPEWRPFGTSGNRELLRLADCTVDLVSAPSAASANAHRAHCELE